MIEERNQDGPRVLFEGKVIAKLLVELLSGDALLALPVERLYVGARRDVAKEILAEGLILRHARHRRLIAVVIYDRALFVELDGAVRERVELARGQGVDLFVKRGEI